jgi:hypothetical protein
MTDYEKEQVRQLVNVMLEGNKDYAIWRFVDPDWNEEGIFSKDKAVAVSIKEYNIGNE